MGKFEKIFNKLRKTYSIEEIADAMLIPKDLTPKEKQKADEELLAFRFKLLKEQTEEKRIYSDLLRFKYIMEDYFDGNIFDEDKTFGKHLEEYIRILKKTKKSLSEDLSINYTRFSRLINDKEEPNIGIFYRLEKHSDNLIPANYWWKLAIKKQEFELKQNDKLRKKEASKVKNNINIAA